MTPINQNPIIWGKGWYAIYDDEDDYWCVAPIEFFDKYHHCSDGWEWDKPEGMSDDEFNKFVKENGCEPNPPKGFSYCMESCIRCDIDNMSYKYQELEFINAGFTIKKWRF